ncbi:MAG: hypothetical protein A3F40_00230 [Chlamydiae bacterium RIFCSPHIGHO2_12_FULL_27_8]|nr:MAG: hypothetical protein A3F40_00230 [Chlamydiae bacterium RIFCSPHIGHO2_12_FULL_27_8]
MNIVILGAGELGSYLASVLAKDEHNVTIIDKDPQRLEKVSEGADIATLVGYGSRWKILDELLEFEPDIFIAMTGDDETNLVSCAIAKNLGYPKTVARVKEIGFLARSRIDFGRLFYVDHFIGAEVLAANDILKLIVNPKDLLVENFAHGAIQMRTLTIPTNFDKQNILLKDLKIPNEMIIGLIKRKKINPKNTEEVLDEVIFPHGEDFIQAGDEVTIVGDSSFLKDIDAFFKIEKIKLENITIVGATAVGVRLAHILELRNINVKIIEIDKKRCEEVADLLPNSTILNEDATNIDFLNSEQIQNDDAFVCTTNVDARNFLIANIARDLKCRKVISLISNTEFAPLLQKNNIKFSVSERINIANRILSILHEDTLISIATLVENKAKVMELSVSEDSKIVGIPLSDLSNKLPKNLLITAIENRGRIMIGKGNRILSPGDTVIVITSPEIALKLTEIF